MSLLFGNSPRRRLLHSLEKRKVRTYTAMHACLFVKLTEVATDRKPIDPPPIVQLKVPEVRDPIRYVSLVCLQDTTC